MLDPWILRFSKLKPKGSVCKFLSLSFFVGSLDPWIPWSFDSKNWKQENLSVRLCLCHFLPDPWILGTYKSRILKNGAKNQLCLFAGSLVPWILRISILEPRGSVCEFVSVSLFVGFLDPWTPWSLDSQNWSQETLFVRFCLCHFLLDPWIPGSLDPHQQVLWKIITLSKMLGSLDPWILIYKFCENHISF